MTPAVQLPMTSVQVISAWVIDEGTLNFGMSMK